MRRFEKQVLLQVLDNQWKDHLAAMDYLRQGIHLRGYAQKNPKQEYKREAFELFTSMLDQIKRESVRVLTAVRVPTKEEIEAQEELDGNKRRSSWLKPKLHDVGRSERRWFYRPGKPMPAVSHKAAKQFCPVAGRNKQVIMHGYVPLPLRCSVER